jgi:hypothetical protein
MDDEFTQRNTAGSCAWGRPIEPCPFEPPAATGFPAAWGSADHAMSAKTTQTRPDALGSRTGKTGFALTPASRYLEVGRRTASDLAAVLKPALVT